MAAGQRENANATKDGRFPWDADDGDWLINGYVALEDARPQLQDPAGLERSYQRCQVAGEDRQGKGNFFYHLARITRSDDGDLMLTQRGIRGSSNGHLRLKGGLVGDGFKGNGNPFYSAG
ncbi:MAG: hypothetical protein DDT32_02000 [Syntrophomonadaceae bacterium]|nr:hypothetical protein [Bacillota bacterium]